MGRVTGSGKWVVVTRAALNVLVVSIPLVGGNIEGMQAM